MIAIRHLSFTYPDGTRALREITLAVPTGQRVALVGPNGAGKSTVLLALVGAHFGEGEVVVDGIRLTPKSAGPVRRRVGMIFQNPDDQLFCPTVADDIAFGPRNLRLPADEIERRVGEQLLRFGLDAVADRPPFHLSLGEKRRASIACALVLEPIILVCDEPSSNLDPRSRRELIAFLQGYERTLVVATHDLDLALDVTERCVILDSGRVVADGPTDQILADEHLLQAHALELPLCLQSRPVRQSL